MSIATTEARGPQLELAVRRAEGGVIVTPHFRGNSAYLSEETVFTNPQGFADYMRAWFVAHHGESPVWLLPQRGFAPNGEG